MLFTMTSRVRYFSHEQTIVICILQIIVYLLMRFTLRSRIKRCTPLRPSVCLSVRLPCTVYLIQIGEL